MSCWYSFLRVFLVSEGTVSMGGMVAAVLLSSRTLAPLAQIANLFGRANNAKTSYKRLTSFMEETQDDDVSLKNETAIRREKLEVWNSRIQLSLSRSGS